MVAFWKKLNTTTKIISVIVTQLVLLCCCVLSIVSLPNSSQASLAVDTIDIVRLKTQAYETVIAEYTAAAPTLTNTSHPTLTVELSTLTPTALVATATETLASTTVATNLPAVPAGQVPACIPKQTPQIGLVVDVVDGDTIKVFVDGLTFSLRYIGIDTPENTTTKEYYGQEATNRNAELVYRKIVTLYSDVSDKDSYGRLLRYVFVDDQFVNLILVQEGFASAFRYPPDTACASVFSTAETAPKSQKMGLWGAPPTLEYVAPLATQPAGGGNAVCSCSGNIYNCTDFKTHSAAQACYNYCKSQGRGDIHQLDRDNDGKACETLP